MAKLSRLNSSKSLKKESLNPILKLANPVI
jgi:hypothetical protein